MKRGKRRERWARGGGRRRRRRAQSPPSSPAPFGRAVGSPDDAASGGGSFGSVSSLGNASRRVDGRVRRVGMDGVFGCFLLFRSDHCLLLACSPSSSLTSGRHQLKQTGPMSTPKAWSWEPMS